MTDAAGQSPAATASKSPYHLLISAEKDGTQFASPPLHTERNVRDYRLALMISRCPLLYAIKVTPKQP